MRCMGVELGGRRSPERVVREDICILLQILKQCLTLLLGECLQIFLVEKKLIRKKKEECTKPGFSVE